MSDKAPDQEPSIEEILASIRQIISDDDKPTDATAPPAPAAVSLAEEPKSEPAPMPAIKPASDDVLELTEMLPDEDMTDAKSETVFANVLPPETPQDPTPEPAPTPRRMEIDMRDMDDNKPAPSTGNTPEAVLTPQAASAALQGFAKLSSHMAVERQGNGVTLEDIVREMLKPMLREWLDGNLPTLIEKLVQKELDRLSRRVQD